MFSKERLKAFTLLEVLAVLALLSVVFGVSIGFFSGPKARLKDASRSLTKDVQGLYLKSLKESTIFRIRINSDTPEKYFIEKYSPPMKKPLDLEDREAQEKWDDHQKAIQELSSDERKKRTRLDRGQFTPVKERTLPGGVKIEKFYTVKEPDRDSKDRYLFFYPNAEMDFAGFVLLSGTELRNSLITQPLSGKLTPSASALTEQSWKELSETARESETQK